MSPSQLFLTCFVAISFVAIVVGLKQEITLYNEYDSKGQGYFVNQTTDTAAFGAIFGPMLSYCRVGTWVLAERNNANILYPTSTRVCSSLGSWNLTDVLRCGPDDTSTPAIGYRSYGNGRYSAYVIEKLAEANINPYIPAGSDFYTTGYSNWTVFDLPNFEGNSTCVLSTNEVHMVHIRDLDVTSVRSILRGCNFATVGNVVKLQPYSGTSIMVES